MTAVSIPPIYNHVIKPVIESVFGNGSTGQVTPQQPPSTASTDSLTNSASADSMDMDSMTKAEDEALPEEPQQADETKAEEEKPEQQTVNEEPEKEEPAKPAVEEERKEPEAKKEEKALPSPAASFKPVTKYIKSTKYTLTELYGDSNGVITAHVTISNDKENSMIDLGDFKLVAEGTVAPFYKILTPNGNNKFLLRKGEAVSIQLLFRSKEKISNVSTLMFADRETIYDVRYHNLKINWK